MLPSYSERYAITLWYFDSPERTAALAKETAEEEVAEFMRRSEAQHGGRVLVA